MISRSIGVNSIICSIFELCFDMSHFEFEATIRRRDSSVLGVVMAFRDNILRIHKISGSSIFEWNNYCRQSGTLDVLEQQLLVNDQFLCVNGQTDVIQMLVMLADVDVANYVIRVRRHRAQIESLQQTITMNGIPDNHKDIAVDLTSTWSRQSELSLAIEASRLSAGMKCCYGCGEWTMNPMRSSSHKDCPHVACSLKCLVHMENDHVSRKIEMRELDESFGVSSSASATSNGCIATCTLSRGRSRSSRRGRSRSPRPRRG